MLQRRLGLLDLTLIAIGAVIGSGIFRNPAVVAHRAPNAAIILGCWIAGGVLALMSAFVYAELSARRPESGGLYAYLRDAFHPAAGFIFGMTTLLIAYTGSTAASAVLFAGYVAPLFGAHAPDPRLLAVITLAVVTFINVLGVREGSTWQNVLVALKVLAIGALVVAGLIGPVAAPYAVATHLAGSSIGVLGAIGAAMLPVLFAYNGLQCATYIIAETKDPARTLPRALVIAVAVIITIYVLVNVGCLRVLGVAGLAATATPAADVMSHAFGSLGARLITIAIALSTLGYMSNSILLGPRIYFQMAADGLLFKQIAWVSPRTRVPVIAILLQGLFAAIIAASGTFEQIVNWVTAPEWAFVAAGAIAVFVFRKRDAQANAPTPFFRIPLHPYSTIVVLAALAAIFVACVALYPLDTLFGFGVMALGGIIFFAARLGSRSTAS